MRSFQPAGRRRRPHFTPAEFEKIGTRSLADVGLLPLSPEAIRIDRFIEKRFGVSPVYDELPAGLLGFTRFGRSGVEEVVVAKCLDEDPSRVAERRIRTTLAHEAGHGLLHSNLFAEEVFPIDLFDDSETVEPARILCRDSGAAYDGRWWEFQANQVMGVLLLPKPLVSVCLEDLLEDHGVFGPAVLPDAARWSAKRRLADVFDVNPIVAEFRLDVLYPREKARDQLTL